MLKHLKIFGAGILFILALYLIAYLILSYRFIAITVVFIFMLAAAYAVGFIIMDAIKHKNSIDKH